MPIITNNDFKAIEYLAIGHITQDLTNTGTRIGGTVTFSGLTAKKMGLKVGIVSSCNPVIDTTELEDIQISILPSENCTTFRNIPSPSGRIQYLYHTGALLTEIAIPEVWKSTPIVHLGPIFNEIDPQIVDAFPDSLIFITPQGWLREVDETGKIHPKKWNLPKSIVNRASAIIISNEDVQNDEDQIMELAQQSSILIVTENNLGARIYWNGDVRRFSSPEVQVVEDTGAGDIFAAAFICRFVATNDPWEATRFAVSIAANSVTRSYLSSIPTLAEISSALIDIVK
ncbi:MAG: PfkB family carbohydrate kinase [Anaerolineaceae bacterium]|nr:PfkB family carbohydrate kinase [Anaerolineaceae bacterium]